MGFWKEQPPSEPSANARRGGRVRVEMIGCSLGDVLDISVSGMRAGLRGNAPEQGAQMPVTVQGLTSRIELKGRIVWVRRTGWRRFEVGVNFEDVSDEARAQLVAIARAAPMNEQIRKRAG
jgi:hypothetical protein